MNKQRRFGRREFLQAAPLALAGAAAFPTIVQASALGRGGAVAPSDRIVMAGIGFGMQGPGNMRSFLGKTEVQWVAVCDLDEVPLKQAQDTVNTRYGNKDCATYKDYRELFARGDLDAVSLAVPDHWHAILSIAAVRAGLDVFGEKPFTHSLREGRALCDAISRYGRVWQTGSWQRSRTTSTAPPNSCATAGSARSSASRSACRPATPISPARSGRRRSRARRRVSTTTPGSARRRGRRTARRACT